MRLDDVDAGAVQAAISQLSHQFQTKDVSEHPVVFRAHASYSRDRNYHATIGSHLSRNRTDLGLSSAGSRPPRGEIWVKGGIGEQLVDRTGSTVGPAHDGLLHAVDPSSTELLGIGPQYSGDSEFTSRMRLHQSWYRSEVLRVPFGTGPGRTNTNHYGNMLDAAAAAQGANFLTPQIFEVAKRRIAESSGVEPFRCLHNMLSSQPMCFNLFGPLVDDLELATRVLRATFPGEVEKVEQVAIEHAPQPIADYLGDGTSFDAFIDYLRPDGSRAFLGIETKLTDQFSAQSYDRPRYRELTEHADSAWLVTSWPNLADIRWNQLWRNQLLVQAILQHKTSSYAAGRLMLVRHPLDEACSVIVKEYRSMLARSDSFIDMPLDALVAKWEPTLAEMGERVWMDRFIARYVRVHGSERLNRGLPEKLVPTRPARAVRDGHIRAVEMIEDLAAFRETVNLYERHLGASNVYFRPTDKGLTVMSLDYERCVSMIGVSGRGTGDEYLSSIPPSAEQVATAYAGYCEKRDSLQRRSEEERFALRRIHHALANRLRLPNTDWFFIHQEWRFPSGIGVGKLDLLAVDPAQRRLVVIELKDSELKTLARGGRGRTAEEQAATYADLFVEHRIELYPFFERLAQAMAGAYDGPDSMKELELDRELRPATSVWWPN